MMSARALTLSTILAICLPLRVLAAKPRPEIVNQIEKALGGQRSFVTRIVIGSSARIVNEHNSGRTLTHLIDTEVDGSGGIRYLARRETEEGVIVLGSLLFGGGPVQERDLTRMHPVGSRVVLKSIEHKDDRVEFQLVGSQNGEYAKLKFMFGEDYESEITLESAMSLICRAVQVDAWERMSDLAGRYTEAKSKLGHARSDLERLRYARELVEVLRELARISEGEKAAEYSREADTVSGIIQSIEPKARKEELASLDTEYAQMEKRLAQLFDSYSTAFKTPGETQAGQQYLALLIKAEENRRRATALGASTAARDLTKLQARIEWIRSKLQ